MAPICRGDSSLVIKRQRPGTNGLLPKFGLQQDLFTNSNYQLLSGSRPLMFFKLFLITLIGLLSGGAF